MLDEADRRQRWLNTYNAALTGLLSNVFLAKWLDDTDRWTPEQYHKQATLHANAAHGPLDPE